MKTKHPTLRAIYYIDKQIISEKYSQHSILFNYYNHYFMSALHRKFLRC